MKKQLHNLLAILAAMLMLCCTVLADTGPKPSAVFAFSGMPEEDYYVTMLSEVDPYGPHHVYREGMELPYVLEQDKDDPAYPVWQKFVDYQDADGYYFLDDLFTKAHWVCTVGWSYYPPERFKLLLYFPESDTFLCSGITERYAFDSTYTLDLEGKSPAELASLSLSHPEPGGDVTLDKSDGTRQQVIGFAARLGITLLVELGLAWLWNYRRGKQLLFIGAVNLVTQCILNAALLFWGAQQSSRGFIIFWYVLLELAVTGIEAALYAGLMPGADCKEAAHRRHAALYALCANFASFLVGLALSGVFPMIF